MLVLVVVVARTLTRPLQRIADAASAFGSAMHPNHVPDETGTIELRRTARAFNDMQARIQRFVEDRERLFASISHDLKTPITRLKLRTELLDDDALRADFHEDLDELDVMVKGALQSVKDSAVHQNVSDVRIDRLVERLTAGAGRRRPHRDRRAAAVRARQAAGAQACARQPDRQRAALRRRLEIVAGADDAGLTLTVRDHGPAFPTARARRSSSLTCASRTGANPAATAADWAWASRARSCASMEETSAWTTIRKAGWWPRCGCRRPEPTRFIRQPLP